MTAFSMGMLAAALWGVAIVALILLTRRAPSTPSKSMREFRRARRSLVPPRGATSSVRVLGSPPEAHAPDLPEAHAPDLPEAHAPDLPEAHAPDNGADFEPELGAEPSHIPHYPVPTVAAEDPDLNRVLESITRVGTPKRAPMKTQKPPRSKPRPRSVGGPRKAAGLTYILVDEAGKPLL